MNFELSDDSLTLRDQARDVLRDNCGAKEVRRVHDGHQAYATALWRQIAGMGWLGAAIPERFGGAGLGYEFLCVIAGEIGRVIAPVPFASSIYLSAEAILAAGSDSQKREWLASVADGSRVGTFALEEGLGRPNADAIRTYAAGGVLRGEKWPTPDGQIADFAIIAARDDFGIGLYHVDLSQPTVERKVL